MPTPKQPEDQSRRRTGSRPPKEQPVRPPDQTKPSEERQLDRLQKAKGQTPVTRQEYIDYNWPDGVTEWTNDHEAELPARLRL
jgi:hypothetical protein